MEVDDGGTVDKKRNRDWSLSPDRLPAGKQLEFVARAPNKLLNCGNSVRDELGDSGGQADDDT